MMGCLSRSFSNTSALVEYPVLVFFTGGRPKRSRGSSPSCWVELRLNFFPAMAQISSWSTSMPVFRVWPKRARASWSTRTPALLHLRQHGAEGELHLLIHPGQAQLRELGGAARYRAGSRQAWAARAWPAFWALSSPCQALAPR